MLKTWRYIPHKFQNNLNCENQTILWIFQILLIFQKYSKFKYQNLKSSSHLLLFLSSNISLNLNPFYQDTLQCSNEWNIFKNRGLHFVNLNINSLLSKIKWLCYITNAAIIGIWGSKPEASVLCTEVSINNCKILCCYKNRKRADVVFYVRNDSGDNTLSDFPDEVENIFFEILLPNSKPITVGTIYCLPSQSIFWKH